MGWGVLGRLRGAGPGVPADEGHSYRTILMGERTKAGAVTIAVDILRLGHYRTQRTFT